MTNGSKNLLKDTQAVVHLTIQLTTDEAAKAFEQGWEVYSKANPALAKTDTKLRLSVPRTIDYELVISLGTPQAVALFEEKVKPFSEVKKHYKDSETGAIFTAINAVLNAGGSLASVRLSEIDPPE